MAGPGLEIVIQMLSAVAGPGSDRSEQVGSAVNPGLQENGVRAVLDVHGPEELFFGAKGQNVFGRNAGELIVVIDPGRRGVVSAAVLESSK